MLWSMVSKAAERPRRQKHDKDDPLHRHTIRYDTIVEFNVKSKTECDINIASISSPNEDVKELPLLSQSMIVGQCADPEIINNIIRLHVGHETLHQNERSGLLVGDLCRKLLAANGCLSFGICFHLNAFRFLKQNC